MSTQDLRWDQRQRFLFLEARVIWAGSVAPDDVRQAFGLGAAQAQADLKDYQQRWPRNLHYDVASEQYRASDRFEPALLRGTTQEFLQVLRNQSVVDQPLAIVAASSAPVEVIEAPEREFDVRILQRVTAAIREKRWLAVDYQSMTHPEPRRLEIAPHALAHTGRWHARAFSREHAGFRDFLLSRIRGIPELLGASREAAPDQDWDWRNFVNVKVGAHPGLTEPQRRVVETDYGMQNGVFERALRVALVPYYLRLLGLGRDDPGKPPAEQQIVLLNRAELDAYIRLS